ncbi:MAG: DegT/DnrJ/EryC1/StrS family aminotransferase [Vicinamibacterales bacterium]
MNEFDSSPVPIARLHLGEAELEGVTRVVFSGWLVQGPEVERFESVFANTVNAPHAVAVSSGTTALQLALLALGVRAGDEVVTVSHSFIATANAILAVGATPVFVDVRLETLGMDPSTLDVAITSRTRAVVCVHQIGIPCDLAPILAIAAARGIPVIEDAACALGSEILLNGWKRIGSPHGTVACFSFHPRKVVTTGEGGMLTTRDAALAARLRSLRQHGADPTGAFVRPGFNARMTDLQAAVGLPQLVGLDAILAERRRLASRYTAALSGHPALETLTDLTAARTNWQSYPMFVRESSGLSSADVLDHFAAHGVHARPGITNAHQEPAYASYGNWRCADPSCDRRHCGHLATSEWLRAHTILLPLFQGLREDEQDRVVEACVSLPLRPAH